MSKFNYIFTVKSSSKVELFNIKDVFFTYRVSQKEGEVSLT